MRLILIRHDANEYRTLGYMKVYIDEVEQIKFCTLELPWRGNQKNISCIPQGDYECQQIIRPNGDWALWVKGVPNRTSILLHKGNFTSDVQGCILIGTGFDDINSDLIMDVVNSTNAMKLMRRLCRNDNDISLRVTGNLHIKNEKTV